MINREVIKLAHYTWSVSPEYIELKIDDLIIRIQNYDESRAKYKEASSKLGPSVVFYGKDDHKLCIEYINNKYYVRLFYGRKNIMSYSSRYLESFFKIMVKRYRPLEERILPQNATDIITFAPITDGIQMVNFHDEFAHGRYYTKETFDRLPEPKKNPHTRRNITSYRPYKAKITRKNK
jgi:hypothetical protein